MNPYRAPAPRSRWLVEAQVRGPLSSFLLGSVVEALDEQGALESFEQRMREGGVVILSEVSVSPLCQLHTYQSENDE
jgi:hypothetical protein